jgi:uncharacterized membrane protein HdeD (DUF308 family)
MPLSGIRERDADRLSKRESGAWGGTLLLGALWCIAGVLCLAASGLASVAAVYYVGALLAIAGLMGIVYSVRGAGAAGLVLGILSLVVGVLLFAHPGNGLAGITLLLIGYFGITGLYEVITSLADRYQGWGMDCVSGLCSLAICALAIRSWPGSAFWLLGTLVGAELLIRGAFTMGAAVTARRAMRSLHASA